MLDRFWRLGERYPNRLRTQKHGAHIAVMRSMSANSDRTRNAFYYLRV